MQAISSTLLFSNDPCVRLVPGMNRTAIRLDKHVRDRQTDD